MCKAFSIWRAKARAGAYWKQCGFWNLMSAGGAQCIATGTPLGYRLTLESAESLVRRFEVVAVLAPGEEEAIRIL